MASKPTAPKRAEAPARAPSKQPSRLVPVPGSGQTNDDAKFDRLVYERVRLGIMSALAVNERLTFNELKSLFDVSDGNLSAHAESRISPRSTSNAC